MAWSTLDPLVDELPDARFADLVARGGYRGADVGYQWGPWRVELLEFEVITWDHPQL